MKRIRSGDTVIVTAGKSKGTIGKVLRVITKKNRVVVQGANFIKKHVRPNPQKQTEGGIISLEASMDVSNVSLYNPATKKADKVGFRFIDSDGELTKVRYFKSNNELVDQI